MHKYWLGFDTQVSTDEIKNQKLEKEVICEVFSRQKWGKKKWLKSLDSSIWFFILALVRGLKCDNQTFLFDYSDAWIKTHKWNIMVLLYTATFGDAVVQI